MDTSTSKIRLGLLTFFCCWALGASAQLSNTIHGRGIGYCRQNCGNTTTWREYSYTNTNGTGYGTGYYAGSPGINANYVVYASYITGVNDQATTITYYFEGWNENSAPNTSYNGNDNCYSNCNYCYAFNFRAATAPANAWTYTPEQSSGNFVYTHLYYWLYTAGGSAITPGCTAATASYSSGNIDSWNVSLTGGNTYNFSTSVGTHELRMYSTDGYTLVASGTGSLNYTPSGSGTYFLEVSNPSRQILSAAGTLTYKYVDNVLPTISCPGSQSVNVAANTCAQTVTYTTPSSNDNCSVASTQLTSGLSSGSSFPKGTTTNVWKVTDATGNTATCSFTVTVTDNQVPTISCPSNISQPAAAGTCALTVSYSTPSGTDNCSGATTTQTAGSASGSSFPVGTTTNTFKVTDGVGLTATCSFTVTVTDNQAPTISCPGNIAVNNTPNVCGATVSYSTPSGTDNCSGASTTRTGGLASGSTFPIGATTNIYKVTDAAGNTATCSFTVTVIDNQAPTISCPGNIGVANATDQCSQVVTYSTPAYGDNCSGATLSQTDGLLSGATYPVGTTTNSFKVTDAAGNTATCSFTVSVTDNQAPTISCPSNASMSATPGVCGAAYSYATPVGTDNCASSTGQTAGQASGTTFPVGVTTNTFKVTDASGNTATCSFTVTVIDNELPQISCPGNITLSNDANTCGALVTYSTPVGTDNCSGATTVQTNGLASGASYPVGVTANTFRVTDASGNTATCSFTVTVNDTQAPSITCPLDITTNALSGFCYAVVSYTDPVGTDNCSGFTTTRIDGPPSGSLFNVGTTPVSFRVTDAAGLTSSCTFSVTVIDNQIPTITCPPDISTVNDAGTCGGTVSYTEPVGTDNCSGASTAQLAGLPSGSTFPLGATTNTFQVTASNGATKTCSFDVNVYDVEAPVINCPADVYVDNDPGLCSATVSLDAPTDFSDNCGPANVDLNSLFNDGPGDNVYPVGDTYVNWYVADIYGNYGACTQLVHVNDAEAPTITCPDPQTQTNDPGQCNAFVYVNTPVYDDNCAGTYGVYAINDVTFSTDANGVYNVGDNYINWYAIDGNGNYSTCQQIVTVTDDEAPQVANCPDPVTQNTDPGKPYATIDLADLPTATDNCGVDTYDNDHPSDRFAIGTNYVTWTVTDIHGNSSTCVQTVIVNDGEEPFIACADNVTVSNDPGQCAHNNVTIGIPYASDNSGHVTISVDYPGISMGPYNQVPVTEGGPYPHPTLVVDFPVGTTTLIWTATDPSGNSTNCAQTVTVNDTEAPSIACPADITQVNDPGMCSAVINIGAPVTNDNCGVASVTNNHPSSTYPVGTTVVTWTVTDIYGNTATCNQNVVVNDNEVPTITCPYASLGNQLIRPAKTGFCYATISVPAPVVGDNCGIASVINDFNGTSNASGNYPVGFTTITWTVTDIHGNSSSCEDYILVIDNQKPVVATQNITVYLNASGFISISPSDIDAGSTDNCGVDHMTLSQTLFTCSNVGANTVTLTVYDASGNSASKTAVVTVVDNRAPSAVCQNAILFLDASGHATLAATQINNGSSDNCGIASLTLNNTSFNCANLGSGNTVTLTVSDVNGNSSTCSANVTVIDNTPPTPVCQNITVELDATGNKAISPSDIGGASTDNCSVSLQANPSSFTCANVGTPVSVTLIATDGSGNNSFCFATVTVEDNTPPIITCPADITHTADPGLCSYSVNIGTATATDNCAVAGISGVRSDAAALNAPYPVGTTTVTWTATDVHGNSSTCVQTIVVTDDEAPALTCAPDQTQTTDAGVCNAVVAVVAPATGDNCGVASVVNNFNNTADASGTYNVGTTTVLWTVTDIHGNSSTCNQTITITDDEHPSITCAPDQTQNADPGVCNASVSVVAPVTGDNCGVASVVNDYNGSSDASDTYNVGTTTVLWTVTDIHGNYSTCNQVITINDNQNPEVTCAPDQTQTADIGVCNAAVSVVAPATSDNCGIASVVNDYNASSDASDTYNVGTTTVLWTVTDIHGNSSTCVQTITITDNENPVITCAPNQAQTADPGVCNATVSVVAPATSDNCGVASVVNNYNSSSDASDVYPVGTTTIVWTVTDIHGNSAVCLQDITITDDEAPSITCAPDQTQTADFGLCSAVVSVISPATGDNCGVASVVNDKNGTAIADGVYPVGTTTVVWMVTDIHGNSSTCAQNINITDSEIPSITCAPGQTQTADPGVCNAAVVVASPATSDNCGVASVVNDYNSTADASDTYNVGSTTIVWTVTDIHGNTNTCTQLIIVTDNEVPSITCAPDQTQTADAGVCNAAVTVIAPATGDNCGVASVVNDYNNTADASGTYDVGTTTVLWTVTDIHGNSSTCSQTITVTDDEAPSITCAPDQTQTADPGACDANVTVVAPTVGDNCGLASLINDYNSSPIASGLYSVGTTTVVWTVTDIHGNSSTCAQLITITDDEHPSITCAPDQTQTADAGVCNAAVTVVAPETSDNCGVASVVNDYNSTADASGTYNVGSTTVLWTVTDIHGNSSTCAQLITITDDEHPSITCAPDQTQTADAGVCNAAVTVIAPATGDNCGVASVANDYNNTADASGTYDVGTTTVLWTVTDIHGNSSTCSQTITVTDDEAPSITCAPDQTQTADPGVCNAEVIVTSPVTGDNCGVVSVVNDYTNTNNASGSYIVGATTVVWTVTDIHGNSSTCAQLITITDDEHPSITCAPDQTQTADAGVCNAAVTVVAPATGDNCGVASVVNDYNSTADASGTYNVGTTTVVWTVTDIHGNSSTCAQLITITDDEHPSITCAPDQTQTADAGVCNAAVTVVAPATGDNCGVTSVVNDYNSTADASGTYNVGSTTVVWTVTDIHGNSSTCAQLITITDDEHPSITCAQDVSVNNDAGNCSAQVTLVTPATGDNCGVAIVSNDHPSDIYPVGSTVVTWTVVDIHGNSSVCTQNVTVTDNEAPSVTCAPDVNVDNDPGLCEAQVTLTEPANNDNCGVATVTNDHPSNVYPVGTTTVVWTITDIHGNSTTCAQTVTVNDNELPTISCPSNVNTNTDTLMAFATVTLRQPVVSDNCGIQDLESNHPSPRYPIGSTEVVWTVTDIHGNTATCSQTVNVNDNEAPRITCGGPITLYNTTGRCDGDASIMIPFAQDNSHHFTLSVDYPGITIPVYIPTPATENDPNAPRPIVIATFPVGTTIITWTATDSSGNSSSCTQTITVIDNENPAITCPADISVNNDPGQCSAQVDLGQPVTSDNCGVDSITNDHPSDIYTVGTTVVTWIVTDIHGNSSSCTQNVVVTDNVNPSITCAADVSVNNDNAQCSAAITLTPPAVDDNCGIDNLVSSHESNIYPVGTTTVIWTVTDIHGNSSTCAQAVTVTDNEVPSITCAPDQTQSSDPGVCNAAVTVIAPASADNCGVDGLINDQNGTSDASGTYNVGSTTIVWTVTDIHGNSSTCAQVITIEDNEAPGITCASDVTTNIDLGQCTAEVTLSVPVTSDNCGVDGVSNDHPSTTYPIGATVVTWTVTDIHGNSSTCAQTVKVIDNVLPVITCPANVTATTNTACTATGVDIGDPVATDNCTSPVITNDHTSSTYPLGVTTVTWTATDLSGNTATCSQTVSVTDNVKPVVTCPANLTIGTNSACTATGVDLGTPNATDNCSIASVVNNHASTTYPKGVTTVRWTVTDGSGNTTTCTQTVTVVDDVKPTITCPGDKTVYLSSYDDDDNDWNPYNGHWHVDNGHWWWPDHFGTHWWAGHWWHWWNGHWWQHDHQSCSADINLGTPVVADNCAVATVTKNYSSNTFPVGTTVVTWTVSDASGNTATCAQTINVIDDVKPRIDCPDDLVKTTNSGCTASGVDLGTPETSDNCTVASVTNDQSGNTYSLGVTNVVWTVTDASGNTATCTQKVTVYDNVKPVVTCPANVNVTLSSGCTATVSSLGNPIATDNCSIASVTNNHSGTSYPLGTTNVTWTVKDGSGNAATCVQKVIVTDNILPTISCPDDIRVVIQAGRGFNQFHFHHYHHHYYSWGWHWDDDNDDDYYSNNGCQVRVNLGTPVVSDNCSGLSVSNDQSDNNFPIGTTIVIWTVTDASGNTATCSQTVTIVDSIAPQLSCPSDRNVTINSGCNATVNIGSASASDNCSNVTITNDHPGNVYTTGATDVTWTATDASGNTSVCTQTITVRENIKPTISCPANITATTNSGCMASGVNLGNPVTADNCGVASVTNNQSDNNYGLGITSVIWTVTDLSGNTATCKQTVSVTDNIKPVISCPDDVAATTNAGCSATRVNLGNPVASDNCTVASVVNNHASSTYPSGTTTVIWTVTDGSGNTSTCAQSVVVTDNDAPSITCPANKTVSMGSGCSSLVSLGTPITSDNCTVAGVSNDHPSTTYPVGTTMVTWTVADAAGNTAICTQTVTVKESVKPTISCPANITTTTNSACAATGVSLGNPVASDNCGVAGISNNQADDNYSLGVTTVIWTVTDASGNMATCKQTVTVNDNIKPTITCPVNKTITVNSGNGCNASGVNIGNASTDDNCSVAGVTNNHSSKTYYQGNTTVVWTVTDGSGNTATCSQVITVVCSRALVSTPEPEMPASSSLMIKAYPNPFTNEVNLKIYTLDTKTPVSLKVFTAAGDPVEYREDVSLESSDLKLGKSLPAGIYLIQVTQGKNIQVERVVKVE